MRTIGEIRLALSVQLADATKRHDTLLSVASGLKQLGRREEASNILDEVKQLRGAIRSLQTACDHLAPLAPIGYPNDRAPSEVIDLSDLADSAPRNGSLTNARS